MSDTIDERDASAGASAVAREDELARQEAIKRIEHKRRYWISTAVSTDGKGCGIYAAECPCCAIAMVPRSPDRAVGPRARYERLMRRPVIRDGTIRTSSSRTPGAQGSTQALKASSRSGPVTW
jgi:hypothetical protein